MLVKNGNSDGVGSIGGGEVSGDGGGGSSGRAGGCSDSNWWRERKWRVATVAAGAVAGVVRHVAVVAEMVAAAATVMVAARQMASLVAGNLL